MFKRFLIFVEDPGAVNMIIDFPMLLKEKNIEFDLLANKHASEILNLKNISHIKIEKTSQFYDFLRNKDYHAFLIGTSENNKSLGLKIIDIGKKRKIKTIAFVDMLVNASERFKGISEDSLRHIPDYLIVTDELTKKAYVNLGMKSERIIMCKHPQEERVKKYKNIFEKKFPEFKNKYFRWLFISESIDLMDPSQSFKSKDYLLNGRGLSTWRTGIIIEELVDILKKVSPQSKLEVRLHPKNTIDQFNCWAKEIKFDKIIDPLESVWKADFILGMSSNLLVEAMYLDKKVLSILPRYEEKKWMSELEEELIPTVFNRKDLLNNLKNLNNFDSDFNISKIKKIQKKSFIDVIDLLTKDKVIYLNKII